MFGEGVYVTRDKWKAEGYRTHHPNATTGAAVNPLLQSGEPDPGCILEFRARVGVCKEFTLDGPQPGHSSYYSWHDDEVSETMRTSSVEQAVAAAQIPKLTYNSAFTAGCSCCKVHGAGCPGHPEKGHYHQQPGQEPCKGRCETGGIRCKTANSSREEFCIWNPNRIDRIKIVEGPKELIGYGEQLWDADPQTLRTEHAKVQRLQNEERDMAQATAMAAYKKYAEAAQQLAPLLKQAALLSGHHSIKFQQVELTQACSKKRLLIAMLGGVAALKVTVPPEVDDKYQIFAGTYTAISESANSDREVDEEITFANIQRRQITMRTFPFNAPHGHPLRNHVAGWWLQDEGHEYGHDFYLVLNVDGGSAIPFLGTNTWRNKDHTVKCQIAVAKLSADDLAARVAVESERAQAAAWKQIDQFGTSYDKCVGFILRDHPADAHPDGPKMFDGVYRLVQNDRNGWPHLINHRGVHCFRHQSLAAWIFSHQTNLGELPDLAPSDRRSSRRYSRSISRENLFEEIDVCRKTDTAENYIFYVLESTGLAEILPIGNNQHLMPMRTGESVEVISGNFQVSLQLISESKALGESKHSLADVENRSATAAARYKEPISFSGFHMRMLRHHISCQEISNSWQQALAVNDETHKRAVGRAAGRVVWHLFQPAICTTLYLANTVEISSLQSTLVLILLARCCICFGKVAMCIHILPVFFRVDVIASLRASDCIEDYGKVLGGPWFVAMYILANDKLLAVAVSTQLKYLSQTFPRKTCACGKLPLWSTVESLTIFSSAASAWLEVCSVAALGLALGARLSSNNGHELPSFLIVAHCVSAVSFFCTVMALWINDALDNTSETSDWLLCGALGVFFVGMSTLCLAFPQIVWLVIIAAVFITITFFVASDVIPNNDDSGTIAAGVGFGSLAVCILFVMVGAGIMFEPDGTDNNCTAYYDGFQYAECNSTLPEIVDTSYGGRGREDDSTSLNTSTSSSSWGGEN